jgi:hypothetical protein
VKSLSRAKAQRTQRYFLPDRLYKKRKLIETPKVDEIVKSRHSRAGGNPESAKLLKRLDSCFHGNDGKAHFQTFYETIKVG